MEKIDEQYLLIKSPYSASGKSRALMIIALDKLEIHGLKQAIIVVPERSIGTRFNDESLFDFGFWLNWSAEPNFGVAVQLRLDVVQDFIAHKPGYDENHLWAPQAGH